MTRPRRQTYSIELNESERYALKTALSHCGKECRRALAQGKNSPIAVNENDIRRIRRRLYGATAGVPADYYVTMEALENRWMHFAMPVSYTITLGKDEMMALDKILSHYQAHCRKQLALDTKQMQLALDTRQLMWTRLNANVGLIRQKAQDHPPTVG